MDPTSETMIEEISAQVHYAWMDMKRANGVTSRKSETGEELMVVYADLSEGAKELDRGMVRSVLSALAQLGYEIVEESEEEGEDEPVPVGQRSV